MNTVHLRPTVCAICATDGNATELYPANFAPADLSPAVFSARRMPDRVHYRMVRCDSCGLVRSDPVADSDIVSQLYAESTFDYGAELHNLATTYGKYLKRVNRYIPSNGALLEIGCGNGFVLAEAKRQGYKDVRGVEPSKAAIDSAPDGIRDKIVCSMMVPGLFPPEQFDAVCLFQVLDHILDPVKLLTTCYQILKPGGVLLCLNHNVEALSARLMKHRSPIIDIEHTYLYSPATMGRLLEKSGFKVRETRQVWNRYSLRYVSQLLPLPGSVKRRILRAAESRFLGRLSSWVPLGNLYSIAQRPLQESR
jgi:SAM-dependent methyltransferase